MKVRLTRDYPSNDGYRTEGEVISINEDQFNSDLMVCLDPQLQDKLMAEINEKAQEAARKNEAARESKKGLSDKLLETLLMRIEGLEERLKALEPAPKSTTPTKGRGPR